MSEIKMLNLYRCSSAENKTFSDLEEEESDYFVTDYFDWIKIDEIDMEKANLQECMGIQQDANRKDGISHQRFCLYSDCKNESSIWDIRKDYPIFTVIQIFINPDLFQAEEFADGTKQIVDNWENKLAEYLEKVQNDNVGNKLEEISPDSSKIQYKIYRLLTAGDFAVIVRSRHVHDAYDIVTAIRGIYVTVDLPENEKREEIAFYTYSICGILNENSGFKQEYLSVDDRVAIRIRYSKSFRRELPEEDNSIKQELLQNGKHLFGRYDHQFFFTPLEFEQVYPYIRFFKNLGRKPESDVTAELSNPLVKMILKGYLSHINERLLLHYSEDPLLVNGNKGRLHVICRNPWEGIYDRNSKKLQSIKEKMKELERDLMPFYQSERNLKEFVRLLGRLGRVFFEVNKRDELRLSLAHLLKQYETLVNSFEQYISIIPKDQQKTYAEVIEENLRYGISALEIFTRYMRNVNLQTLQTPNYDLQTNVSVVKLLLAYSFFLEPYVTKKEDSAAPYEFSRSFHPIIVPSMRVKDMTVLALFQTSPETDHSSLPLLMVVYCPTFAFLCETCFLVPAVFHEIAHQFRYERRDKRNRWLKRYVLKQYISVILMDLLDIQREYEFEYTDFLYELTDFMYDKVVAVYGEESNNHCLQEFQSDLLNKMLDFTTAVNNTKKLAQESVKSYIDMTRGSIQEYDDDLLYVIQRIDRYCESIKHEDPASDKSFVFQMELKYETRKLKDIQEKQICREIISELEKIKNIINNDTPELDAFAMKLQNHKSLENTNLERKWQDDVNISSENILKCDISSDNYQKAMGFLDNQESEQFGEKLFVMWMQADERHELDNLQGTAGKKCIRKLWHLLKQYHNINSAYRMFYNTVDNLAPCIEKRRLQKETFSQAVHIQKNFSQLCQTLREEMLNRLDEYTKRRRKELIWTANPIPIEKIQVITKELRMCGNETIEKKVRNIFMAGFTAGTEEFVSYRIKLYREVTSDLFMCSAIGLDLFGYLVVSAEVLKFNNENRGAQMQRIFLVEQCLAMEKKLPFSEDEFYNTIKNKKEELHISFRKKLKERLIKEINNLVGGLQDIEGTDRQVSDGFPDLTSAEDRKNVFSEIDRKLVKCIEEGEESLNSTQKWIIRIYRQIIAIAENLLMSQSSWDAIGDRDIMCDLISKDSYYSKKEEMAEFAKMNGDKELLESISSILNSPASFFAKKKSLLQQEITFIFDKYEQSCRKIFEKDR